jgi:tRNA modification GTPase
VVVTKIRHYEALSRTQTALYRAANGLNMGISGDFLSQDIREAMHYLGEITGEISTDEVLGNIFRHFCIGK